MLILFRVIQGATGGALQPLSQAVLLEAFPPAQRGKAMGFWGLGIVVAPILGPVLGGWLTDSYSWRWVFYINLPVGIVVARDDEAVHLRLRRTSKRETSRVDYWGIGLLAVGIGALQMLLDKGQEEDWFASHFMTAARHHLRGRARGLPRPRAGRRRARSSICASSRSARYARGVFLMTMLGFVLYGSLVLLPILLQTLLGYPSLQAGIAMAPRGHGLVHRDAADRPADRPHRRAEAAGGGPVRRWADAHVWLGQLNLQAGYWDFFWPQFIQGARARRCCSCRSRRSPWIPIPRERMGNATSLFNLMRNIGGSIGIAVTGTMLARHQQVHYATLGTHVDPYNPPRKRCSTGCAAASWPRVPIPSRPPSGRWPPCSASCSGRPPS